MWLTSDIAFTINCAGLHTKQERPAIKKMGTIDCDMVETTPLVFRDRLYRFEYVRPNYKPNKTGNSYFRFVDVKSGETTPGFASGYHLGSAYTEDDVVYAYGVDLWGESNIQVFWSDDMENWSSPSALNIPGWGIYNTSVCKGSKGYVMAFEVGEPPEEVGARFTNRFAVSSDLLNWELTHSECVYSRDRYTACPALRFLDGFYYMIYLEARPGPTYEPHMVRTEDLIHWESSPHNPVMRHSDEDKIIGNPDLTVEQKKLIADAVNINNSDVDLCEFNGEVIIYYSWGNQQGVEFLAHAFYNGTLESFLKGFFHN
jgi:hypothetical protein